MDKSNFTQFKLTNGDEIIAEIVDEPTGEDVNLVIRKAMQIYSIESAAGGYRYYGFKPWMVFQMKNDYLQLLNYTHIIGEAKPDEMLFDEYKRALESEMKETEELAEERKEQVDKYYEELKRRLQSLVQSEADSDNPTNVVSFRPNKDKMH